MPGLGYATVYNTSHANLLGKMQELPSSSQIGSCADRLSAQVDKISYKNAKLFTHCSDPYVWTAWGTKLDYHLVVTLYFCTGTPNFAGAAYPPIAYENKGT